VKILCRRDGSSRGSALPAERQAGFSVRLETSGKQSFPFQKT